MDTQENKGTYKKWCILRPMLLIILLCVSTVLMNKKVGEADIIWEPEENDFYNDHKKECEEIHRDYTINDDIKELKLYSSPKSKKIVGTVKNGEDVIIEISVSYKYKNNNWGCALCYTENSWIMGWTNMDYLTVVYDVQAFREEHSRELQDYNKLFDFRDFKQDIKIWSYPNSMEELGKFCYPDDYNELNGQINILRVYNDEKGYQWGEIDYFTEGWICITDPLYEGVKIEQKQADSNKSKSMNEQERGLNKFEYIIIILVVGVVMVTTFLIIRLKKHTDK